MIAAVFVRKQKAHEYAKQQLCTFDDASPTFCVLLIDCDHFGVLTEISD
jgi:hypothetical protein